VDVLSPAECSALRARLLELGFTDRVLAEAEAIAPNAYDAVRVPLVHWALARREDPPALLARLFCYDDAVPEARVRALLGDALCDGLRAAGVIDRDAGQPDHLRARRFLVPFQGLWIVSDHRNAGTDSVMGPGPTTFELVRLLPDRLSGSLLDVGTGAGTFALLAALRGARRAVGTDLNPRAIETARLNARLNGVTAEFYAGDLIEPVRGQRFDRVIAQPPYVVQPAETPALMYLHGGAEGDAIARRLLGVLADILQPGGCVLMGVDLLLAAGETVHQRLRGALGNDQLDLIAFHAPGASLDLQAVAYASLEAPDFGAGFAEAARRYREHLERLDRRDARHAVVSVRDRGGRGLTLSLAVNALRGTRAATLERRLEAFDLAARSDADLLAARVAPGERARWVEERPRPDPDLEPSYRAVFPPGSLAQDQELSANTFVLVELLGAAATVGEAVDGYAERCGARPDEVRSEVLDFVRRGLAVGVLEPVKAGA
jgi:SAM-dependent methyltransferase